MIATSRSEPIGRGVPLRRGWRHMRLSTAVEHFLADCKLRGLTAATIYHYKSDLDLLVGVAKNRAQDSVIAFTGWLLRHYLTEQSAKNLSMATLHRRRSAISQLSKFGRRARYWMDDPSLELPSIRRPKRLPRPFKHEDRDKLMALPLGKRDALLRGVLFYTGLRVTAAATIRMENVSLQREGSATPGSIRVITKGDKEHVVPIHDDLHALLVDYLSDCLLRGEDLARRVYLFEKCTSGLPDARREPWTRRMVERRVRGWGRTAQIAAKCTPHVWRHTFGTTLTEEGVDLRDIARLMAHEDMSTTMLYTKVADKKAAAAITRLPSFFPKPPEPITDRVTGVSYVPPPSHGWEGLPNV